MYCKSRLGTEWFLVTQEMCSINKSLVKTQSGKKVLGFLNGSKAWEQVCSPDTWEPQLVKLAKSCVVVRAKCNAVCVHSHLIPSKEKGVAVLSSICDYFIARPLWCTLAHGRSTPTGTLVEVIGTYCRCQDTSLPSQHTVLQDRAK